MSAIFIGLSQTLLLWKFGSELLSIVPIAAQKSFLFCLACLVSEQAIHIQCKYKVDQDIAFRLVN